MRRKMSEHSPGAIRVAKLLSAAQRRCVIQTTFSRFASINATNPATIANLRGLGLCNSVIRAPRHATLTPFGLEVRAVLMEGLK
jgi:hypothetical protein